MKKPRTPAQRRAWKTYVAAVINALHIRRKIRERDERRAWAIAHKPSK